MQLSRISLSFTAFSLFQLRLKGFHISASKPIYESNRTTLQHKEQCNKKLIRIVTDFTFYIICLEKWSTLMTT